MVMSLRRNLFIDLENTVIDDLEQANFLDEKCEKIKAIITAGGYNVFTIYTWGWLNQKEIEPKLIQEVGKKLGINIESVITKDTAIRQYANSIGWVLGPTIESEDEIRFHDYGWDKIESFKELTRLLTKKTGNGTYGLVDDLVKDPCIIEYLYEPRRLMLDNLEPRHLKK